MKKFIILPLLFSSIAAAQPTVLMVGTSHDDLGNTGNKTGVWLSEMSHAYDVFKQAGFNVTLSSVDGNGFPLDPGSLDDMDASAKNFLLSAETRQLISDESVISLNEAMTEKYQAVYLIGGHGVMWDFRGNQTLDTIISTTYANDGTLGAVCHGVAGLLTAKNTSGDLIIQGKKLTGFSDEEESAIGLTQVVPFSLERALIGKGANYSQTMNNFSSYVITDDGVVTGQNPASATAVAKAMVEKLIASK